MGTRSSAAKAAWARTGAYRRCPSCGARPTLERGRVPRVCCECGAPFVDNVVNIGDAGSATPAEPDDAPPRLPFQTFSRPQGRPLLGIRTLALIVVLVLIVASVKALRKKAALELLEEQTGAHVSSTKGPDGFVMIDVTPPRSAEAPATSASASASAAKPAPP